MRNANMRITLCTRRAARLDGQPWSTSLAEGGKSKRASRQPKANACSINMRYADGTYRHITLALLAHAVIVALRVRGKKNT